MKLTPHFTLEEFTASETATRRGIDNTLPAALRQTAVDTCEMMERIRTQLERLAGREIPIVVTSGYRSPALNAAIGSAPGSDHPRAMAVDFKAPAFGTPFEVASALAPLVSEIGIGQLIHEFGSWVHVSTRRPAKDVNRIITISARGTVAGVQPV
ncbi:MAG TPA: D-Ala-D-Ala carboxypeptidase family metallohydrolase [Hyphomicrobiaceae bacterium]|nr:D-Ala-D-Ala carboxypeptidase family metallohydrolase [Hyphomicrobiaceae bacterium]